MSLSMRDQIQNVSDKGVSIRHWNVFLFAMAFTLRGGWSFIRAWQADFSPSLEFPDETQYWDMARSFWNGTGLRDELGFQATRMPLYPVMLSPFTTLEIGPLLVHILQAFMGAFTAVGTSAIARRFFGARVGILAGLFVCLDPFLVFFSSLMLTETAFIAATVGFWWLLSKRWFSLTRLSHSSAATAAQKPLNLLFGIICGVVLSFGVYLRESGLGMMLLALFVGLASRRFQRPAVVAFAAAICVVILSLLPWAARNQVVLGEWCWLTTRAGISLYDGVRPGATGASNLGDVKQSSEVEGMSEADWNRHFLTESVRAIRSDPGRILWLAAIKASRTWNPFPNANEYRSPVIRFVAATWSLPLFLFAAVGATLVWIWGGRNGRYALTLLLTPAVCLTLLHTLFVGSVRYRLAAIPMIAILSACGVVAIFGSMVRREPAYMRGRHAPDDQT